MKHINIRDFPLIILIGVMMGLTSLVSNNACAQGKQHEPQAQYGFEASAGIQSLQLSSNLVSLNELKINQHGGSIGFTYAEDFWRMKIKPVGFYNSRSNLQASTKLIESGAQVSFYPIKFLTGKTSRFPNLYFTAGAQRAKININGSYLPEGQTTTTCIYETFSTSIVSWNVMGGAGIEYQIKLNGEFITIFAEINRGFSAGTTCSQDLFRNTSIEKFTVMNIGFSLDIKQ